VADRVRGTGCPYCNQGWTISAVRTFVSSLREHLTVLTPAELYVLFQQSGLADVTGKSRAFVKALATGRFPLCEVDKFLASQPSLVDQFLDGSQDTLEDLMATSEAVDDPEALPTTIAVRVANNDALSNEDIDQIVDTADQDLDVLPIIQTKDVLASLGYLLTSTADEEAVEFLISSALAKLWKHAFHNEEEAIAQGRQIRENEYAEQVRNRFLEEYTQATSLPIPPGYTFHDREGKRIEPNLMQRLIAVRVQNHRRVGNWSGTGAGKTLSALLASRVIGARLTVILCPNSVVGNNGWQQAIRESFPESIVQAKTFLPSFDTESSVSLGFRSAGAYEKPHYLILNYEAFQQETSEAQVRAFVQREQIDFIIIDEIHFTKQRTVENISRRRELVATLIGGAAERNPHLHVLGMSATPVINNLQEGKSMIELVTSIAHDDLDTRPTIANCMALYQHLIRLGIRWIPAYTTTCEEKSEEVDCSNFLDEIRALGRHGNPLALEQILTRARLPLIQQYLKENGGKTLIYTHNIQAIDRLLWETLVADGWRVGFYTGEEKSGLDDFLYGNLDVLIGSSAIATGINGLQEVCSHLVVNVLPWTAAEYEQIKGRVFRQGQQRPVTIYLPLTYAIVNGERWSWCESKMKLLRFKKTIADSALDGVVPEGHLRSPAQAYQNLMAWLKRLDSGDISLVTRSKIIVPLPQEDETEIQRRLRQYGAFSTMNHLWNQSRSETTHDRLQVNAEEWALYHTLYREQRKKWAVIPYEEMIRWCRLRSDKVIGDFGCGEALLSQALSGFHTVYSFDHIAINEDVIACDMVCVPLESETLDVAIFSLSLMGANFAEYLQEAHRTLKLDGLLHIIEATERFQNRDRFVRDLERLGFAVVRVEDKWKFTHIQALKTELTPPKLIELQF